MKITKTTINQKKKQGTKTVWIDIDKNTEEISENFYNNFINAAKFFRRMGASVKQDKEYTCRGYLVTRDITTRPSKDLRTITLFHFA